MELKKKKKKKFPRKFRIVAALEIINNKRKVFGVFCIKSSSKLITKFNLRKFISERLAN